MSKLVLVLLTLTFFAASAQAQDAVLTTVAFVVQIVLSLLGPLLSQVFQQNRSLDSDVFHPPSVIPFLPFGDGDVCDKLRAVEALRVEDCFIKDDQIFVVNKDGISFSVWETHKDAKPDDVIQGIPSDAVPVKGNKYY